MRILAIFSGTVLTVLLAATAQAFCGFYVAKADASLFNEASQVVLVRDGNRTVITMANDFKGDVEDFAVTWNNLGSAPAATIAATAAVDGDAVVVTGAPADLVPGGVAEGAVSVKIDGDTPINIINIKSITS